MGDHSKTDWMSSSTVTRRNVTWPLDSFNDKHHLVFHASLAVKLEFLATSWLQLDDSFPGQPYYINIIFEYSSQKFALL